MSYLYLFSLPFPRREIRHNHLLTLFCSHPIHDAGYADKGAMWRDNYGMGDDIIEVAYDIYDTILPLYKQLHAYVRRKLHTIHTDHVDIKGRIPANLLGTV